MKAQRERERLGAKPNDKDVYDCKYIEMAKENKSLICNPIYNFTDFEVWAFIRDRGIKYNPLYDKGFHRVGCVGCPLSTKRQLELELELYPIYRDNYKRAFKRMLDERKARGKDDTLGSWKDAESVYKWWVQDDTLDGQLSLFDEVEK